VCPERVRGVAVVRGRPAVMAGDARHASGATSAPAAPSLLCEALDTPTEAAKCSSYSTRCSASRISRQQLRELLSDEEACQQAAGRCLARGSCRCRPIVGAARRRRTSAVSRAAAYMVCIRAADTQACGSDVGGVRGERVGLAASMESKAVASLPLACPRPSAPVYL